MFQRRGADGALPTTTGDMSGRRSSFESPFSPKRGSGNDGSGKAIKMDAPIVKSWKQASSYTKYTYYIVFFFVALIFVGYRYLRFWNASIWLTCHAQECTLELTPPGARTMTLEFPRAQLHSAQAIKTDKAGNFMQVDTSKYEPYSHRKNGKGKKNTGSYKGPDENGHYRSYTIKFRKMTDGDHESKDSSDSEDTMSDGDFNTLREYMTYSEEEEEDGIYLLHMRKFGLTQSRTRIRSMINKVDSYIKRRRQKLLIKESAPLPWQGILCLIFGLLGVMMTLLIGQFWDEPPKRQGGPGARRSTIGSPSLRGGGRPKFMVDTGRPSKLPPGYKKY